MESDLCEGLAFFVYISAPHAGDLIALGSKPSGSKPSLRHVDTGDEPAKPSKASGGLIAGGNPPKKFKSAANSGDNSGGLFSDPIRVSQVSQQATAAVKQVSSSKTSHGPSPQPSGPTAAGQQIIEGMQQ